MQKLEVISVIASFCSKAHIAPGFQNAKCILHIQYTYLL